VVCVDRNVLGVLRHRQLICRMLRYACPIAVATSGSCSFCSPDVLPLLQTYLGNRQIHEDFGIPFFADHVTALNGSLS
jgi:hypothetical protein